MKMFLPKGFHAFSIKTCVAMRRNMKFVSKKNQNSPEEDLHPPPPNEILIFDSERHLNPLLQSIRYTWI